MKKKKKIAYLSLKKTNERRLLKFLNSWLLSDYFVTRKQTETINIWLKFNLLHFVMIKLFYLNIVDFKLGIGWLANLNIKIFSVMFIHYIPNYVFLKWLVLTKLHHYNLQGRISIAEKGYITCNMASRGVARERQPGKSYPNGFERWD